MGKKKTNTPEDAGISSDADAQANAADSESNQAGIAEESGTPKDFGSTEAPLDDPASEDEVAQEEVEAEPINGVDDLEDKLAGLNDRHLRLVAEFTNYRRRAETELSEAWTRGQADMLRSFVDGLDDLQRVGAFKADNTTVEALIEGVDLVERKFRQALEAAGVEMLDPVGEVFDPNFMEAMLGVPTQNSEDDQKVQDVFQKGYSFKGHLVRPARVTVFKHE